MTSFFNQINIFDFQPTTAATKSHSSPQPHRREERNGGDGGHDIEAVAGNSSQSSGSCSQPECREDSNNNNVTSTNNTAANIRSRGKNRSTTATDRTSTPNDDDNDERLPFLESSGPPPSPPDRSAAPPPTLCTPKVACYLQWVKLLAVATVMTNLLYLSPSFFLSTAYFPARGRMFPWGLKSLIYTPTIDDKPDDAPIAIQADSPKNDTTVRIPRIIHVTYKSRDELPEEWEQSLQIWEDMHPDWELRFWSDADIEEFVRTEFPQYVSLHESYKYVIQRVDSVRYMILYHFGGLYSDMDIYPRVALDGLLSQWEDAGKNVLLAETSNMGVTNAFMASAPQSPFMGCAVENLPNYRRAWHHVLQWRHWEVLSSAGSTYLWGMVGHCGPEAAAGVRIVAQRSFRGCSVCDAWETGKPAETCDTEWLGHSSTNSSWHQHGNLFHSFMKLFAYSFLCEPFRACFVTVTLCLFLIQRRRNGRRLDSAKVG